jgi:hypothetical protein
MRVSLVFGLFPNSFDNSNFAIGNIGIFRCFRIAFTLLVSYIDNLVSIEDAVCSKEIFCAANPAVFELNTFLRTVSFMDVSVYRCSPYRSVISVSGQNLPASTFFGSFPKFIHPLLIIPPMDRLNP